MNKKNMRVSMQCQDNTFLLAGRVFILHDRLQGIDLPGNGLPPPLTLDWRGNLVKGIPLQHAVHELQQPLPEVSQNLAQASAPAPRETQSLFLSLRVSGRQGRRRQAGDSGRLEPLFRPGENRVRYGEAEPGMD